MAVLESQPGRGPYNHLYNQVWGVLAGIDSKPGTTTVPSAFYRAFEVKPHPTGRPDYSIWKEALKGASVGLICISVVIAALETRRSR